MPIQRMRLQRMIALSTELSRRAAEKLIASGKVSVNGQVVTVPGTSVNPLTDRVCMDGRLLQLNPKRHYLAFCKPRGFIVTKSDPAGRPTIWEHLEEWKDRLNAVGRLDFDSEGLLILTNDGDFLNRLTHPRHEIWKTYLVRLRGVPDVVSIKKLTDGIELEDGKTLPAKVKRVDHGDPNALLEIAIREGKNRQVRRMCSAVGFPVTRLKRTAVGSVKLGRMKPGQWRHLKEYEVEKLLSGIQSSS